MKTIHGKLVDRLIPQKLERRFRLGRRLEEDRRFLDDRRLYVDEDYHDGNRERRDLENNRRNLIERRQRWFRISKYRSRHM